MRIQRSKKVKVKRQKERLLDGASLRSYDYRAESPLDFIGLISQLGDTLLGHALRRNQKLNQ
jgi:hypothetical protein